jgi:hypothetical protein
MQEKKFCLELIADRGCSMDATSLPMLFKSLSALKAEMLLLINLLAHPKLQKMVSLSPSQLSFLTDL